ncbi:late transcription unit protein LtuB [Chlamydia trachomatis]|uniref:late transcription unit protein LtuB n=1 Tax=Chlamydia trachomatis TaxID=813 RepID=UPI0001B46ECF|nr:late transcription unit protein LtuB [Chlamydia trachomatis]ADH16847.1 late transcription unit B protein [Chlamydia trachomatis E/150]ADH20539.1 late transcription unit B protein [Chlamydia trachomatis E/11023]AGR95345.1 late transcription unit B protein [Chlamydia trachomatis RC-F(s)/852]AGR99063.1 late transcription unit B protein [Chlamydia trachomatis RC-F(s)/342]AGT64083.1 Late transcription unit B protein [Chlamydia trachomatis]
MKKRSSRKLAQVIGRKTGNYFPASIECETKKEHKHHYSTASKEKESLRKRAKEFDVLVHSLLDKHVPQNSDQVLIFTYQNGFVETDFHNFGRYSVKL